MQLEKCKYKDEVATRSIKSSRMIRRQAIRKCFPKRDRIVLRNNLVLSLIILLQDVEDKIVENENTHNTQLEHVPCRPPLSPVEQKQQIKGKREEKKENINCYYIFSRAHFFMQKHLDFGLKLVCYC